MLLMLILLSAAAAAVLELEQQDDVELLKLQLLNVELLQLLDEELPQLLEVVLSAWSQEDSQGFPIGSTCYLKQGRSLSNRNCSGSSRRSESSKLKLGRIRLADLSDKQ